MRSSSTLVDGRSHMEIVLNREHRHMFW